MGRGRRGRPVLLARSARRAGDRGGEPGVAGVIVVIPLSAGSRGLITVTLRSSNRSCEAPAGRAFRGRSQAGGAVSGSPQSHLTAGLSYSSADAPAPTCRAAGKEVGSPFLQPCPVTGASTRRIAGMRFWKSRAIGRSRGDGPPPTPFPRLDFSAGVSGTHGALRRDPPDRPGTPFGPSAGGRRRHRRNDRRPPSRHLGRGIFPAAPKCS